MTTRYDNEDTTDLYLMQSGARFQSSDVREMEEWLRAGLAPGGERPNVSETAGGAVTGQTKPRKQKLARRTTNDPIGRPQPEGQENADPASSSLTMQAIGGVDDAGRNALGFLDPLANWLDENVVDLKYSPIPQPATGTGAFTRKTTEFLTGFIPAMKGLKAIGVSQPLVQGALAGAIADFTVRSPHEGRLSDLWNDLGLPKNVLTDYLSSKEDDSEMEARFKNTLEGVVVGTAFDGIILAARALRSAKNVPGVKEAEEKILREKYGSTTEAEFKKIIGDPSKPSIQISVKKPHPIAKKIKEGGEEAPDFDPRALIRGKKGDILSEDFEVYVNFARFDEPNQIKFAIGKMAEAMKPHIDQARRGSKITLKEMDEMADELGFSVADVLKRRKGQLFNFEESIAARRLWAASGEKLVELAKKAAGPNAGAMDQFAFRQQMAVHAAIQAEVIGARTETARALASWKIEVKGDIERARAIQQVMQAMGGPEASQEMARRLAILAEEGGTQAAIGKLAAKGFGANTVDAIKEVWINGLLSSPKTHAVNITSNTMVAFQQIYERAVAAQVRNFTGGEGVVAGEATAMLFGMVESLKDAFRMSAKALKTGESGWAFNKIDVPRTHALTADALHMSRDSTLGRAVDFMGTVTRVPGRLLVAEDEFFKTIGYRMELKAQALRMATSEGHTGAALAARIDDIVKNPPEHIMVNSADAALYNTFSSEIGWMGRSIMNMRNAGGALNPMILVLPFVRTPVNISRYAFERTPFAPLVGQWRADIAAGGARADLALARMSTGTAIMMVAMDLADSGMISGEGPRGKDAETREALLRQGWQPYSIKIGDRWYSYNRADPFGMTMGFAASIAEAMRKGEMNEDDVDEWHEVMAMAIAAVSQVTISKTYLEGLSNVIEVASDPSRYSKAYVEDLIASFLPFTSLSSSVKNMVDPIQREAGSPAEAVQARIVGLSSKLPPRRNLWGEEITSESGLGKVYDFTSPVMSKGQKPTPVDKAIVTLGQGPERIAKQTTFDGVRVNMRQHPDVYDAYVRLSGNDLKHPAWGLGAKDFLNQVISGQHPMSEAWKIMSDDSRRQFISNTVSDYRKLAQRAILADPKFKSFAMEVDQLKRINQQNKLPVL